MDRMPILYVKGEQTFAEDFRLMVRLDTQSLSRTERSETFLQFAQDIFVHGITSSEIGSTFHGEHEASPDTTEYSLRANSPSQPLQGHCQSRAIHQAFAA